MSQLLIACGIVMILEGIPWFLSPQRMRHFVAQLASMPDAALRLAAVASMGAGLLLVYLVTR
ncbi:DUF2065 domain-containing protein [Geothermobacter hydrogeniphilus]|uniref:DUF2065 domain-containing protein n=1 Tax=Geothermobacter hydrogeniphilus TaxID=1969733 RepID=A0A2K2H911_9BACT|nr:DUF2065 domain-containing protein [Geothermobacter hydrogeniphilus]PNU19805.1 DUF2065 domain-containing protein [Geothermobacter hydrogeniphilus]